jgi:branched-chain amino acid aminotransferase
MRLSMKAKACCSNRSNAGQSEKLSAARAIWMVMIWRAESRGTSAFVRCGQHRWILILVPRAFHARNHDVNPDNLSLCAARREVGNMDNSTNASTHAHGHDARNEDILIDINGEHFPRAEARVSVFDAGFILGDGVWEGLRVHNGKFAYLDRHLERLYEGAKALDIAMEVDPATLTDRLHALLRANGMDEGVHVRLMVTRGLKTTPYQDPRASAGPPTIVIIAEHKEPLPEVTERGVRLFTVHVRRGYPDVQDPKLNSHSKLNCILACIQASKADVDEALMLDPHGFVATCNSTHFFIVRRGEVWTSSGDFCLDGITRGVVLEICREQNLPYREKNFSLTDVYAAEEAFVTGTFAGLVPVTEVDGRTIGEGTRGPAVAALQAHYIEALTRECQ